MPNPQFEPLSGTVNGVNAVFTASKPYTPGTTAVYLNGQLLFSRTAPGGKLWAETSPALGTITIASNYIPIVRTSDAAPEDVAMFYLDTEDSPVIEVTELRGTVRDIDRLGASLDEIVEASGSLRDADEIGGTIADMETLAGALVDVDRIAGILEVCP